jgi:hypothetical protein
MMNHRMNLIAQTLIALGTPTANRKSGFSIVKPLEGQETTENIKKLSKRARQRQRRRK